MLPHSLVAVSLVTALFTNLAHSAAAGRLDQVRADLSLGRPADRRGHRAVAAAASSCSGRTAPGWSCSATGRRRPEPLYAVALAMTVGLVPFSAQYLFSGCSTPSRTPGPRS